MFRSFRERTRRMQEEAAEKRAANEIARAKLFVDAIVQAQEITDPELRKAVLLEIAAEAGLDKEKTRTFLSSDEGSGSHNLRGKRRNAPQAPHRS